MNVLIRQREIIETSYIATNRCLVLACLVRDNYLPTLVRDHSDCDLFRVGTAKAHLPIIQTAVEWY